MPTVDVKGKWTREAPYVVVVVRGHPSVLCVAASDADKVDPVAEQKGLYFTKHDCCSDQSSFLTRLFMPLKRHWTPQLILGAATDC